MIAREAEAGEAGKKRDMMDEGSSGLTILKLPPEEYRLEKYVIEYLLLLTSAIALIVCVVTDNVVS